MFMVVGATFSPVIALWLLLTANASPVFYVAPNGSPSGNGSVARPWDLQTALNQPRSVAPGAFVCLKNGTYYGRFVGNLRGNANSRIAVSSCPGEQATIDGNKVVTLTASIPAGTPYTAGDIRISDASGLSVGSVITVDGEDVQVGTINGNKLRVNRGWNGTNPLAHWSGAQVKLRGSVMTVNGDYVDYSNLVITDSNPVRLEPKGANIHGNGFSIYAPHARIFNNVIHDCGQGIGFWVDSVDSEVYGNIVFNNGYQDSLTPPKSNSNWLNGHGIYTQNERGTKTIADNIIFNQFGFGLHVFSTNSVIHNYMIKGNVHFNDLFLVGGLTPLANIVLEENYLYNGPLSVGYDNPNNSGILIKNNFLPHGLQIIYSKNVSVSGNTFWCWESANCVDVALSMNGTNNQISDYLFSNNLYYQPPPNYPYNQFSVRDLPNSCGTGYWFNKSNDGFGYGGCTHNSWQDDLGYDRNSNLVLTPPPSVQTFIRINKYDPNRAHVIVYNWNSATSVKVNLKGTGFNPGDSFVLRNAENYLNESVNVTSDAADTITVRMTGWTIAEPIGSNSMINSNVLGASTYPKFGVFVLIRAAGGPSPTASRTATPTPAPQG